MPQRFGSWHLDALIAVGGICEVWHARRDDGEIAALKRLHTHLVRHEIARAQFAIEQKLATTLPAHPHLIHGSEADAISPAGVDSQPYVALEFIPGQDLRRVAAGGSAAIPRSRALSIVVAACDAAAHLHTHGWVHGDINPGNLIVDFGDAQDRDDAAHGHDDRVVLIDLGVARRVGEAGTVRGTHAYMAPEQIRGEAWTPATDVFALGVVAWELLAGTRLFHRGPPWLSMAAVMETQAPPLPDSALDAIVRSALEKDPSARPPSPTTLAAALRDLR